MEKGQQKQYPRVQIRFLWLALYSDVWTHRTSEAAIGYSRQAGLSWPLSTSPFTQSRARATRAPPTPPYPTPTSHNTGLSKHLQDTELTTLNYFEEEVVFYKVLYRQ